MKVTYADVDRILLQPGTPAAASKLKGSKKWTTVLAVVSVGAAILVTWKMAPSLGAT